MYGFMHCALAEMIIRSHGEELWTKIMKEAGFELGGGSFLIHKHYSDKSSRRLFHVAADMLGQSLDDFMEHYGEYFFKYCIDCGYDRLLKVLGGNMHDFLCNLDVLHDHLSSIYPGMKAPSFRCSMVDDGSILLTYHSDRPGFEGMVKGILKVVAREFFDSNLKIDIITRQGNKSSCTVFSITEDTYNAFMIRKRSASLVSHLHRAKSSTNPKDLSLGVASFCKAFPFHIILDRQMRIVQAGVALLRVLHKYRKSHEIMTFRDLFDVVRPITTVSFDAILDHIHTVFIVRTRPGVLQTGVTSEYRQNLHPSNTGKAHTDTSMRLKGQMVFVAEIDHLLFLCSPRVNDIDELRRRGLYLSDIPIHDATRDLILIAQARRAEHELVEKLEETSNNLKRLQARLQEDKRRTDELLLSILPYGVAERLRLNQAVEAEKYTLVTILFSDIVGFTSMCGNERIVPMDIVRLLNRLYTHFDVLSNYHDVHKVETIGDAYMVVGGMPLFTESHADRVTSMAFSMMSVSTSVLSPVDQKPLQIRIGIHSGPCVAGVVGQKMPRYCLFGNTVTIASQMEAGSLPGKINISETAKSHLSSPESYEFEENKSRQDIQIASYFVTSLVPVSHPVPMDLGVPEARGMFRTPNPSPNPSPSASRCATPCDDAASPTSPAHSPQRLNSPESTLQKFKMPAIRICDADEDARFRASLQLKMTQILSNEHEVTTCDPTLRSLPPNPSPVSYIGFDDLEGGLTDALLPGGEIPCGGLRAEYPSICISGASSDVDGSQIEEDIAVDSCTEQIEVVSSDTRTVCDGSNTNSVNMTQLEGPGPGSGRCEGQRPSSSSFPAPHGMLIGENTTNGVDVEVENHDMAVVDNDKITSNVSSSSECKVTDCVSNPSDSNTVVTSHASRNTTEEPITGGAKPKQFATRKQEPPPTLAKPTCPRKHRGPAETSFRPITANVNHQVASSDPVCPQPMNNVPVSNEIKGDTSRQETYHVGSANSNGLRNAHAHFSDNTKNKSGPDATRTEQQKSSQGDDLDGEEERIVFHKAKLHFEMELNRADDVGPYRSGDRAGPAPRKVSVDYSEKLQFWEELCRRYGETSDYLSASYEEEPDSDSLSATSSWDPNLSHETIPEGLRTSRAGNVRMPDGDDSQEQGLDASTRRRHRKSEDLSRARSPTVKRTGGPGNRELLGIPRAGVNTCPTRRHSDLIVDRRENVSPTLDVSKLRENGRLVLYFKGKRPRSVSPSARVPMTTSARDRAAMFEARMRLTLGPFKSTDRSGKAGFGSKKTWT